MDKKLYMISDRPGSIGKTDIYVVEINEDGSYNKPKNLGPQINTEEREMFPFISDENILYFSSDGHPGFGDLDVFASKIFDTTVSEPINLENQVNSKKDDFAYIIDDTKHKGYFSSNRKGGKGDDDIYGFVASPPLHIDCNQAITGVVRDKETQELIPGAVVILQDDQGIQLAITNSDEKDASFSFDGVCDKKYKIIATSTGYLREELIVKTVNDIGADPLEENVDLAPELIVVDEKIMININTIYFDFDKWNIRADAAKELDKVIAVMKDHPSMIIEGGSHTDSRAKEAYNQELSEKRAKATVDYLVAGGIEPNRLTAKGYGEMQLVNNCSSFVKCSREEHQLNRRTEFVIVNDDDRFVSTPATLEDVQISEENITTEIINPNQKTDQAQKSLLEKKHFHIISGAFKNPENAIKRINELNKIGYNAKILGVNQWGLTQVSIKSFDNKDNALIGLSKIQENLDKDAWLFVQRTDKVQKGTDVQIDKIQVKNEELISIVNGYIKIQPIYFEFDKWSLSDKELLQLDQVVKLMKENPDIIIEVGAHTDSKNREGYNQILSDKRAKSVVKYLISKGVDSNRVTGKGYGEMRLVNHCKSFVPCTSNEQQENRRIEFMIVKGNGYPEEEIVEKQSTTKFINTNPIYFDFDKFDIRKDAAYELDRVIRILENSPLMIIEAGSHTDSNNTESYNQVLSEKRAKSVKEYFIYNGITQERIISKGYGEMELTNHCKSFIKCTPEEHQMNRRTEFKIVKM